MSTEYEIRPVKRGGSIVGLQILPGSDAFRDRLIDLLNDLTTEDLIDLQDSAKRATGNLGHTFRDPAEGEAYAESHRSWIDQALQARYPDEDNLPVPAIHLSGTQGLTEFMVDIVNVFNDRNACVVAVVEGELS